MVIDTGHPVHPDIGDNAIPGKNFIANEPIEDENGHQLHCTGIICAKDNETGMVGVAPEAKCISVKALAKNGGGSYLDNFHLHFLLMLLLKYILLQEQLLPFQFHCLLHK